MPGAVAIGIDLGGTQVRVALVEDGKVIRRAAARTDVDGGPAGVLQQFSHLISEVCNSEDMKRVAGVGVSAPGPLDTATGTVLHIPTLPNWDGFPLRDVLAADLKRPVVLENDGIAAAYGEWQYGAGRGLKHLVYVTVSTGIGGGVVVDGRLLHGRRGMAAHVGHFLMAREGPRCSCGTTGCFEALASGTALDHRARALATDNPDSVLGRLASHQNVGGPEAVAAARQGDPLSLALLREEAKLLGAGFTSLIHLYSPECVIMGGGVSQAFDLLTHDIHAVIRRDAMPPFKDVQVVPAGLGENCGLIGAASLALLSKVQPDFPSPPSRG